LNVQVRDLERRILDLEKVAKRLVQDDLSTVLRVLQTLFLDVAGDASRDFGTRDEFVRGETQELLHLRAHLERLVEPVVDLALLALLAGRVVDVRLNASDELGEELEITPHRGDFVFDVEDLLFGRRRHDYRARCELPTETVFKP